MNINVPDADEQTLIASDVAIVKLKSSATNIKPQYFKWKDIWDDDLWFIQTNGNKKMVYRAMTISVPMYVVDEKSTVELTFRGYITGVLMKNVTTQPQQQIFPLSEINWADKPVSKFKNKKKTSRSTK